MTRADEVSDDMLMALADGELPETDAARLHERITADPALAARYAVFVDTRSLLQQAFPASPVPSRLIDAVLSGAPHSPAVVAFPRRAATASVWGAALAACIMLALGGFWAGRSTAPGGGAGNIGAMTAHLGTGEDAPLPGGSTIRVLASYETDLGLCRMIAQDRLRHLTCRDAQSGEWALALSVGGGDAGAFLPASDLGTEVMERLLDDMGAGPALTGAAERDALSR